MRPPEAWMISNGLLKKISEARRVAEIAYGSSLMAHRWNPGTTCYKP